MHRITRAYVVFEKICNFTLVLNLPTDTYVYQVNLLTLIVTKKRSYEKHEAFAI